MPISFNVCLLPVIVPFAKGICPSLVSNHFLRIDLGQKMQGVNRKPYPELNTLTKLILHFNTLTIQSETLTEHSYRLQASFFR